MRHSDTAARYGAKLARLSFDEVSVIAHRRAARIERTIARIAFFARFGNIPQTHKQFACLIKVTVVSSNSLSHDTKEKLRRLGVKTLAHLACIGSISNLKSRLQADAQNLVLRDNVLTEVRDWALIYDLDLPEKATDCLPDAHSSNS